jgi:pimeloyl-ACP methyl ester carboxylesterase
MKLETRVLDKKVLYERDLVAAELSEGFVHYEYAGMNNGPVVVLIHGLSVSSFVWKYTYDYLRDAGYRVLKYDLYGRGFSYRLEKEYTMEVYLKQLSELLTYLQVDNESLFIIGQSMGGTIATSYCLDHELDVHKLVLIATAGLSEKSNPLQTILNVPLLGKRIFKSFGMKRIIDDATISLYDPKKHPEYKELFQEQALYKGYTHAILSSLRNMPLYSLDNEFERLGATSIPTLILWGEKDTTINPKNGERLKSIVSQAELHYIEEAGHHPHFEQPQIVNSILGNFFES